MTGRLHRGSNRMIPRLVLAAALGLAALTAKAAPAWAGAEGPLVIPEPIQIFPGPAEDPAISGVLIAWEDLTTFNLAGDGTRISYCVFDPMTLACPVQQVPATPGGQLNPDVDWPFIVWQREAGWRSGSPMHVFNVVTRELWPITAGLHPRMSGQRIVYSRTENDNRDVYTCLLDPKTGACPEEVVADGPALQTTPVVAGELTVWFEQPGFLFYRDGALPESGIRRVESAGLPRLFPAASLGRVEPDRLERIIVWMSRFPERETFDLHFCRFLPGEVCWGEPLTTDPPIQSEPAVSGPFLVWKDGLEHGDVYFADLRRLPAFQPYEFGTPDSAEDPLWQTMPDVSGNRVVWIEGDITPPDSTRLGVSLRRIPVTFLRGDVDFNGKLNITDPIVLLMFLFRDGPAPHVLDAADVDDNAVLDVKDALYLLEYLFRRGPEPAPPFQVPGLDLSPDPLI